MTESQAKQVWDEAWETARSYLNCSEEWLHSNARADALQSDYCKDARQMVCKSCGGNNADVPCAYPEGGQPHCLRAAPSESREAWAVSLIQAAIDLMSADQIGRWTGVRAFLESSDDAQSASPAALTVPEGYRLVRAELRDEMVRMAASPADHSGDSADMVAPTDRQGQGAALSDEEIFKTADLHMQWGKVFYVNADRRGVLVFARAILARASSSQAEVEIAESYVLVPKEPTIDMLVAGINANIPLTCDQGSAMAKAYRAMLAAAEAPNAKGDSK
jgi:hypothetical protein